MNQNSGPIIFLEDLRREREILARTVQLIDVIMSQTSELNSLRADLDRLKAAQGDKQ